MFDIGFWELSIIAVIGLIVLGPERLPVVARTLGSWVGKAKGYMRGITSELEREVNVDELRQSVKATREQIEAETRSTVEPVTDPLGQKKSKPEESAATGDQSAAASTARQTDNPTAGQPAGRPEAQPDTAKWPLRSDDGEARPAPNVANPVADAGSPAKTGATESTDPDHSS